MNTTLRTSINELHELLLSDDPVSAYETCSLLLRELGQSGSQDQEVLTQLLLLRNELASCWCKGLDSGRRHVYCQAIASWPLFRSALN